MATATAAYCMKCQQYVFVTAAGDCVHGHPRANLRGIYLANVDVRTGVPLPPQLDRLHHQDRPAAPVAPVAEMAPGFPAHEQRTAAPLPQPSSRGLFGLGAAIDALDRLIGEPRGKHSARRRDV